MTTAPPQETDSTSSDGIRALPLRTAGYYLLLLGLVVFYLLPMETGFMTSIKTAVGVRESLPFLLPGTDLSFQIPFVEFDVDTMLEQTTDEKWRDAYDTLSRGMVNSMLFTIPSTILCAIFGSMAAYGLTLVKWRGQVFVLALFIAGIFIPYQAVIIPLTELYGFIDLQYRLGAIWALPFLSEERHPTILELIITHTAYGIPICTVLFRAQYQTMSWEMIEAARLDGAGLWRIYRRIVLPLSIPMFSVVFIFQFTQIWNEFLFSVTLIRSSVDEAASVTLILGQLGQAIEGTDFPLRMAGAFVAAAPTIVVYILFTDKFAEGVRV
ncbi:carbohydrate ABC transporter permease [Salinarchaeum laminariae]|uniref:carbohydrate ABC transporter permease n=1 Tax=Salinarchaeum laminariae TaxID=869888 RepID=UPI0020BD5900|nr:carbohydrate ABC transporter permease [Salinarchaeum laminariae]